LTQRVDPLTTTLLEEYQTFSHPMHYSQSETPLVAALNACLTRANTPFYTPGHKRGVGISAELRALLGGQVFRADLPELPELDNLFAPVAAIAAAQALAADLFGADRTWFLVNGSTCGVIAAILATCNPGDKIILPRNIHQSAIAGLILAGAVPLFIAPEYDADLDLAHSIAPAAVAEVLAQHPETKAVMMVYPTYYGVAGDVTAIAHLCHQRGIPLLVDEAHGAHFAFHPELPVAALVAGADLTVQSTHKTLSALTQSAMLHVRGDRIVADRISKALQIVQSTSPSYLLLASLDAARQQMATQGQDRMAHTLQLADRARSQIAQIPGLSILRPDQATTPGFQALDRTRLTVFLNHLNIDGFTADTLLHEQFGVTAELPTQHHLTFIISLGNTVTDIEQLVAAWWGLVEQVQSERCQDFSPSMLGTAPQQTANLASIPCALAPLTPRQAFFAATETLPLEQTLDRISAELVCPYPPGIPLLLPGERITAAALTTLQIGVNSGGVISGCSDPTVTTLQVVRDLSDG
jgi:arginine decarboxylase